MGKLEDLERQLEVLKARVQKARAHRKEQERKFRTRRLIEVGATLEKFCGPAKNIPALLVWLEHHPEVCEEIRRVLENPLTTTDPDPEQPDKKSTKNSRKEKKTNDDDIPF